MKIQKIGPNSNLIESNAYPYSFPHLNANKKDINNKSISKQVASSRNNSDGIKEEPQKVEQLKTGAGASVNNFLFNNSGPEEECYALVNEDAEIQQISKNTLLGTKEDFWEDKENEMQMSKRAGFRAASSNSMNNSCSDKIYSNNHHQINENIKPLIATKSVHEEDILDREPSNRGGHRTRSEEHGLKLYEKGRLKLELSRLLFTKHIELKQQEELKGCTFQPSLNEINSLPKEVKTKLMNNSAYEFDLNEPIYYRQAKWKSRSIIKTSNMKNTTMNDNCTFKPAFSDINLNTVFEDKGFNQNTSIRKYLDRQSSARSQKDMIDNYKKKREAPSPNLTLRSIKKVWGKSRIVSIFILFDRI